MRGLAFKVFRVLGGRWLKLAKVVVCRGGGGSKTRKLANPLNPVPQIAGLGFSIYKG